MLTSWEMNISPCQRAVAGPGGAGCEDKMRLRTPRWGSVGLRARDLRGGGRVAQYPLKPHYYCVAIRSGRLGIFLGLVPRC